MNGEVAKDENELCYVNVQETVQERKTQSSMDRMKMIMTKPAFTWTALAILITLVIITVVLPTVLEVTKSKAVNGNWGNWTSFSDCSHSCGGGTQFRVRSCNNPGLAYGGILCPGNDTHNIQSCNLNPCPVDGGWGNWTSFSTCSKSCGSGTQARQRKCDSPKPKYGGADCSGNDKETKSCQTEVCPVHGMWGTWTEVSGCSHSCGGGTRYRLRMCNNPSPSFGGNWCSGNATEIQQYKTQACPDYKSAFTVWGRGAESTSTRLKFKEEVNNIGGHYNINTGQFTCQYSGLYVFSLHILKAYGASTAYCSIRKNGSNTVRVYTKSSSNSGYYGASNSVVLHLLSGNVIDVGDCTSADTIHDYRQTSFSGFLLNAD